MGPISKWLLHDDQKDFFEYLVAVALNAVFLALVALVLWPPDRTALTLALAKGYWNFWIVLILTAILLRVAQRIFRMDLDSHYDAYVISALIVSGLVQAGWSAFAALTIDGFVAESSAWTAALLYAIGVVSCWIAFNAVSAFYMGSLYRLINLYVAVGTFALFSVWPAAARATYGWLFDLWPF